MRNQSTLLLIVSFISSISTSFACNAYPIKAVTTGIYYHQGVHEDATEQNLGAIANVGFIIGENCVAVIDSGGSYLEGSNLRQAIRKQTPLPICYVINTHAHPDHLFGNAAFKQDKPEYIGHEKLANAIAARQGSFEKTFKQTLGKSYKGTEFILPTMVVSSNEPMILDLGNRTLTLTAYSTSHTDHDLTIRDNKTNTLWTGDLLFVERIPVLDGSINGWINTMEKLLTLHADFVVPGHGPSMPNGQWQQAVSKQLHYFTTLRDELRIIINEMGSIDQAVTTVGLQEEKKWELFPQYHRRNITASFVQLEWE